MNADTTRNKGMVSAFIFVFLWLMTACAPTETPTPFRPPTHLPPTQPLPTTTSLPQVVTRVPPTPTLSVSPTPTEIPPCTDNLTFVSDVTIPDGTIVAPGSSVDKQWLVTNSGACDWDSSYRLKWVGGDPLGAATEQALYPARAGTQITLKIIFTAPTEPGTYGSTWQAFGPDGTAFGDTVYVEIVVQ
ncbi:MAG: NBR1-Ig-like domain-containing protein [Chloroflexota bacterium]